ncbi:MAG: response regulator [Chloroflexota bacterium]|jgi:two-component system response regulator YesN
MPQVILVDDNIKALDGLRRHIPWQSTGCVCVGTAQNGVEALELCRTLHPDVVITDVKMPQMDGIELCHQLHQSYPDMQLIVISAYDDFSFAQKAMAVGVKHYVLKPMNHLKINELTQILTEMAQRAHKYTASISAFFTSNDVDALRQALMHTNEATLFDVLGRILKNSTLELRVAKEIATHLVAVVYQHTNQLGLPTSVGCQQLNDRVADIQTLHTAESVYEYVLQIYLGVCRHINHQRNPSTEHLVQRIQQYIDAHYCDAEISTYTIAEKFHLSQSYLCQIYRTHLHASVHATITRMRMARACAILKQEKFRSIAEVGREVGYMDAQYFAKVFRRICGSTPSEYRDLSFPL